MCIMHVHTLAAKSMAGIWQIMETKGQHMKVQKKHPMKETMDRMRDLSLFVCMALCRVDGAHSGLCTSRHALELCYSCSRRV